MRSIDGSDETVRRWFLKFGRLIARNFRRSRPRASARWHLDEMVSKIRGPKHWLWRAVYDEGEALDFLVQRRRVSTSDKKRIVAEAEPPGASVSGIARQYGITRRFLFRWKHELAPTTKAETTFLPVTITDAVGQSA